MATALIGYTGFVGSNLMLQHKFDDLYNSRNIGEITGKEYDMAVCAGVPAAMWLANNFPDKDLQNIKDLLETISRANIKRFVLISSIAVYRQPVETADEDSLSFEAGLAYGKNRRYVEEEIERQYPLHHIVRLPALFGENLKKNFLYDLLNPIPSFINARKWEEIMGTLSAEDVELLSSCYDLNSENGMYGLNKPLVESKGIGQAVLDVLKKADFTALKFTHPQSRYQFYDLSNLWRDINIAVDHDIPVLNLCSAPSTPQDIARRFFDIELGDSLAEKPLLYDMRTKYASLWGKTGAYQYDWEDVQMQLGDFFKNHQS